MDFLRSVKDWLRNKTSGREEITVEERKMAENNAQNPQNKKMEDLRAQVDSVKTIMTDNVERILERGERLDNMQQRTEDLAASSANFKMNARRVQRKMCMLNAKWTIIAVIATIIGLTIIILIILSAAGVFKKN